MDKAKLTYNAFTFISAVTLGFMSYRYRRMRMSMIEAHEAAKNVSMFSFGDILNDAMLVFIGFTIGNLIAADYIYKRRIYIVERLHFEKQSNFNRYAY